MKYGSNSIYAIVPDNVCVEINRNSGIYLKKKIYSCVDVADLGNRLHKDLNQDRLLYIIKKILYIISVWFSLI